MLAVEPSLFEAKTRPTEHEFTVPYRFPYQLGVFMAVNAIPDAYCVIDGPDCIFRKAEWIHGKHDIHSTLLDVLGQHRIAHTNNNAETVILSRGEVLEARVRQIDQIPGAAAVFVSSMPHVTIIGTQYDRILRRLQPELSCHLMEVPSRGLHADWLHGYADVLEALAAQMDLTGAKPEADKVAVVGYLMDRTEQDHMANVREFERLFAGIGLELVTVWLGNTPYDQLTEVKRAGTIVSLPSGRAAARLLAERTGARLVEVELPFGATATTRMLEAVAKACGLEARVKPFVDATLGRLVPRLEWVVPHVFMGRRIVFGGVPHLFRGLMEITSELGMTVEALCSPAVRGHLPAQTELSPLFGRAPEMLFAPPKGALERTIAGGVDLGIGDMEFLRAIGGDRTPWLMFGFPSFGDHALWERPFLGYSGWICFLDQMAHALRWTSARAPAR